MLPADAKPLWCLSAVEAVELLRLGKVTPRQLVDVVQQRVEATDGLINAIPIRCFDRARQQADELQARGHPLQPRPGYLYGLPVLIKDLTAVKGLLFTKGHQLYKNRIAAANDPLVDMIEASGGIVVGKSNVPELGAGAQTYNNIFGTTTTPWDTSRTAGGSSGGSTAALAAGQVWLATGTDLGGSQRIPAAFCGVVGLRPSVGLVPQHYTGEQAPSLDCSELHSVSGPLARNVPDLALLLDAMAGQHPGDPLSRPAPSMLFSEAILPGRLPAPKRIAWTPDLGGIAVVDAEVADVAAGAAAWFRSMGAQVVEASPDLHDIDKFHGVLRAAKFKPLAHLLQEPARSMTKPELVWEVSNAVAVSRPLAERAEAAHKAYVKRLLSFLEEYDMLMLPTVIVPPFDARTRWLKEANGKRFSAYYQWQILSYAISVAPVPAMTLPVGTTSAGDLPIGLQIVGRPGCDAQLLAVAAAYERAHHHCKRVPMEPRSGADAAGGSREGGMAMAAKL